MGTCAECEEKERTSKTRNEITQGGCVRCKHRFKGYNVQPCKGCNLTCSAEDKFPSFELGK